MALDFKKVSDTLVSIEKFVDVNRIEHHGLKIWPLIRLLIYMSFDADEVEDRGNIRTPSADHRGWLGFKFRETYRSVIRPCHSSIEEFLLSNKIRRQGQVDALFFSRRIDFSEMFNGRYVDRYIDPLIDLVCQRYRWCRIETQQAIAEKKRLFPSLYIGAMDRKSETVVESWDEIVKSWSRLGSFLVGLR